MLLSSSTHTRSVPLSPPSNSRAYTPFAQTVNFNQVHINKMREKGVIGGCRCYCCCHLLRSSLPLQNAEKYNSTLRVRCGLVSVCAHTHTNTLTTHDHMYKFKRKYDFILEARTTNKKFKFVFRLIRTAHKFGLYVRFQWHLYFGILGRVQLHQYFDCGVLQLDTFCAIIYSFERVGSRIGLE